MSIPFLQCGKCLGVNSKGEIILCVWPMNHEHVGHWNREILQSPELFPGLHLTSDGGHPVVMEI